MEKKLSDDVVSVTQVDLEAVKPPSIPDTGAGLHGGAFNLANAALGAGLLTFPNSFARTGISAGIVLQIVFSVVTFYTVILCGETARLTRSDSFTLICQRFIGRKTGRCSVFILITFSWFGCIAYLTVIGTQLEVFGRVLEHVKEGCAVSWYAHPMFTTTVVGTIVVFPLVCLRDISALSSTSVAAVGACWYVTAFVSVSYFMFKPTEVKVTETCYEGFSQDFHDVTPFSFIVAVPAICFGYHCQICSIPIFAGLNSKAKKRYPSLTLAAVAVCLTTYTAVGYFGAMTFGGCAGSRKLILDNYPGHSVEANVGRIFVAIAVATSYPVVGFVGRQEVCMLFETACRERCWVFSERNIFLGTARRRLFWCGTFWYVSTLLFAIFVPEIKWVINLTGMICSISIFVLPGTIAIILSNLYYEDTFAKTLQRLPGSPSEDSPDSWAFGIRERVPFWLSSYQRRAVWWSGAVLVCAGCAVMMICVIVFRQDVIMELAKEHQELTCHS